MSPDKKATLFLVATPIGNLSEASPRSVEVLKSVDVIACEDTRNSKKLLSHFDIHTRMITYHNFNERESSKGILSLLEKGEDVALISDAGYPLISDPGYLLVQEVIKTGFAIVTVSGPNAGLNALVASGLPTGHYAPHRIEKTLKLALKVLGDRRACLARELTKLHEEYHRDTLSKLCELHDLKGEMVLIIEGQNEEKEVSLEDLLKEVKEEIKAGMRSKEAISTVAKKYDVSKNSLYEEYLKQKEDKQDEGE